MGFICLPEYGMQRPGGGGSQCMTKTARQLVGNHIITRMLRGSLNTKRAADGLG